MSNIETKDDAVRIAAEGCLKHNANLSDIKVSEHKHTVYNLTQLISTAIFNMGKNASRNKSSRNK